MSLTDLKIRTLKPKEKAFKVYDEHGLYLQVTPSGGKWWRFKYRFGGKEKLLSFGTYPDVTLLSARDKRDAARKLLASEPPIDPSEKRKTGKLESQAKLKNNFELWAEKWWQHWHQDKSPRHAGYVKRRLESDVYPILGKMPITSINAHDIVDTIQAIAERGALDIAKRAHQTISQIFRYAIAHGKESKAERNPAADIKPSDIVQSRKKQNYARVDIKELPSLLKAMEYSTCHPVTRLAVKLMALTFVRTSELIGAEWEEFDFDDKQWRIPPARMKMNSQHIVPLSKQAIEALNMLKPHTGNSKYLFPNQNDDTKVMSNNTILKALEIIGYKHRMTGHGFRGVASTALHEQGFEHQHIELQLAHQERNAVSAAYNHALYLKQRAEMMQHWADYLDQLKNQ